MKPVLCHRVKPVLFVTGHAPPYRVGALARLHELEGIELALFGGPLKHGGPTSAPELPFPHTRVRPHELLALAGTGRYRAVVCPTGGRLAPLATWAGARRARVPLILWASLWAHPRSAAHALTYLPLRRLYRSADAVVTYGPHVSAYVSARGARNVHVAPQSVDNDFWRADGPGDAGQPAPAQAHVPELPQARIRFLFVGRDAPEKGLNVLLGAWRTSGLRAPGCALVLAGVERARTTQAVCLGRLSALQLRSVYAACQVLVVPSVRTRTFREPWGLVVNEAMNRGLAVIATDAVGAAAGGLVRDGENGLIVAAGDSRALAGAIVRLSEDDRLRARLGTAGARDVLAFNHDAWAEGFSRALDSVGVSRVRW
ncbi:MAG TPA: glycosyltransferase family 4 protein [Solirubrobacteraceae bacterium]|nr:glycosyltransferase family 4 protein [Solirubrobacteraceae bacterium]